MKSSPHACSYSRHTNFLKVPRWLIPISKDPWKIQKTEAGSDAFSLKEKLERSCKAAGSIPDDLLSTALTVATDMNPVKSVIGSVSKVINICIVNYVFIHL